MFEFVPLRGQILQDGFKLFSVRPRGQCRFLRSSQSCRRDHLHGLGDLLNILDRRDAFPDLFQSSHMSVVQLGGKALVEFF